VHDDVAEGQDAEAENTAATQAIDVVDSPVNDHAREREAHEWRHLDDAAGLATVKRCAADRQPLVGRPDDRQVLVDDQLTGLEVDGVATIATPAAAAAAVRNGEGDGIAAGRGQDNLAQRFRAAVVR